MRPTSCRGVYARIFHLGAPKYRMTPDRCLQLTKTLNSLSTCNGRAVHRGSRSAAISPPSGRLLDACAIINLLQDEGNLLLREPDFFIGFPRSASLRHYEKTSRHAVQLPGLRSSDNARDEIYERDTTYDITQASGRTPSPQQRARSRQQCRGSLPTSRKPMHARSRGALAVPSRTVQPRSSAVRPADGQVG